MSRLLLYGTLQPPADTLMAPFRRLSSRTIDPEVPACHRAPR